MRLPNGPSGLGLIAYKYMIQWVAQPLELLDECAQRYGDPFTLGLVGPFPKTVFFSSPQAIQQIFTATPEQVDTGRSNSILKPVVGENSLLLLDGDRHQQQKTLLMPPFHGERMRTYGQIISDVTQQVASQWQIGQPFSARSSTQEISLQVILRAVFGLTEGEPYHQLKELLKSLLHSIASPARASMLFFRPLQQNLGSWSPWGSFLHQMQQIDALLYAEIQKRCQQLNSSREDILSLLLSVRDDLGEPMSQTELRDELITLLVAGHDTTASAIAWALYWIHQVPGVLDKLLEELDNLGADPDLNAIARLPYLSAVCQETLRIYPLTPIAFPRITKLPLQIGDYQFEPGVRLVPCIYLTHRREDLYPDSDKFKPERFLEQQFSPYEYLPFGGGNRRCIGFAFAQFEMKLVLATLLSRWQLNLASPRFVRPVRRGVTIAPSNGVQIVVTGRRDVRLKQLNRE